VTKTGQPHGETYVVCLDCGKQFEYDLKTMHMGKPIDRSREIGVLPPNMPKPRKTKLEYALLAAVPAAVVLGVLIKRKEKEAMPNEQTLEPTTPEAGGRRQVRAGAVLPRFRSPKGTG
jgi:hypothetical protein